MPGQRVRELIAPLGFDGGKTIVDDYLREVRPLFDPPQDVSAHDLSARARSASSICGSPAAEIPVGHGQTRRGWVVVACLGYSRAGAGALIFSKQIPDLLFGIRRCLWSLGALPQTLVWDRQAGLHAGGGRPTEAFAAFCGRCGSAGTSATPRDPQAKGVVERLQDFVERSFEPGRRRRERARLPAAARRLVRRRARTRGCTRRCAAGRSTGCIEERAGDGAAARDARRTPIGAGCCGSRRTPTCASTPATTRSTRGWSAAASRPAITEREVLAVALDTGELACRHARSRSRGTGRSPRSSTPAR